MGRGDDRWWYRQLPDGEFQLAVTAVHWVSSYDAFVFRSGRDYPRSWKEGHYWRVGDWLYFIGAQKKIELD